MVIGKFSISRKDGLAACAIAVCLQPISVHAEDGPQLSYDSAAYDPASDARISDRSRYPVFDSTAPQSTEQTPVAAYENPAATDKPARRGKLLLTNGITGIEGASGGGIASAATIAGNGTKDQIGLSAHLSIAEFPDYGLVTYGAAIGLYDRLELSYARQNFDTKGVGAALGLGYGFTLNQDIYGAKLRVLGDMVYGDPLLPQIAVGVQHKRNLDGGVTAAVGARNDSGTDFYVSATKLFLAQSLFANATLRYTKANQNGLLGFGGDLNGDYSLQFEGSLGYQFSRRLLVGGEYRTKPDNLSIAREDDWLDIFAAYAISRNITATAAYVDLGSVATAEDQRGGMLSVQAAF